MPVVYAAPHYTPPPGVVVLPLELHPAVIEDSRCINNEKRPYKRKERRIGPTAQRIREYLLRHGEGTSLEIGKALGITSSLANLTMQRCPEVFEEIGERDWPSNRWKSITVWGLVQES